MAKNTATEQAKSVSTLMGKPGPDLKRTDGPTHEEIAQNAYARWEQGGRKLGMADLDWIRAEEELTGASL